MEIEINTMNKEIRDMKISIYKGSRKKAPQSLNRGQGQTRKCRWLTREEIEKLGLVWENKE
jgi:hypothetical protein